MMNVEGTLRAYLQSKLGVPVYVSVPENPPSSFAVVERTGGSLEPTRYSTAQLVVDYWAKTRAEAWSLANSGDNALYMFKFEEGVIDVGFNTSCVHYPDETAKRERYESTYLITIYE